MIGLFGAGCAPPPPDPVGAPVVLVSLDTLRADRLGAYGNPDGLTPNLDRFAAEGVVFEQAYSQTTTTAPSHASLFTSRYPSEQNLEGRQPGIDGMPTLAEVLGAYGWRSGAFVAGGDLSPEMEIGRGFGTWESVKDFGSLWHTAPPALAWLDANGAGSDWLLFVHGYDAHSPYLKPTPYGYAIADASYRGVGQVAVRSSTDRLVDGAYLPDLRIFHDVIGRAALPRSPAARAEVLERSKAAGPVLTATEADLEHVRHVYDGGVAYADTQFGLLMAGLEQRGILDRATVIVFSDHGEQLGEDGLFNHCCGVGDEESHVVLMARLPGGQRGGGRVSGLVELVDVMPTIVDLAGGKPPAGARGVSLLPALRGEPFEGRAVAFTQGGPGMREVGARTAAGRLVWYGVGSADATAVERLRTAPLPGPAFTASEWLDADAQAGVRDAMVTWLASLAPPPSARGSKPLSTALKKELREHGYFEADK